MVLEETIQPVTPTSPISSTSPVPVDSGQEVTAATPALFENQIILHKLLNESGFFDSLTNREMAELDLAVHEGYGRRMSAILDAFEYYKCSLHKSEEEVRRLREKLKAIRAIMAGKKEKPEPRKDRTGNMCGAEQDKIKK